MEKNHDDINLKLKRMCITFRLTLYVDLAKKARGWILKVVLEAENDRANYC